MKIHTVKALKDNYVFILQSDASKDVTVIDPSEAQPVLEFCKDMGFQVKTIINTHHHYDHVGGNAEISDHFGCEVLCHASDLDRTPAATVGLNDQEIIQRQKWQLQVIHIPGHTQGQIALYSSGPQVVFVGDTLFRFGCGRLFEGSAEQMWHSLEKLKALPVDTKIYCGHEYGLRNLEFVKHHDDRIDLQMAKKKEAQLQEELNATGMAVPFTLQEQLQWNPFLKAENTQEFAKWRQLRDQF